ncbi:hypothetical protein HanRHA438_Chr06g0273021 [Helianthus annuus]|nr:hypothetical protein HanHA300_Chr06g0216381 [Helianthus annuus]KAJ0912329.1 hypothetical protein HanRHA438_Chr06g0273021 [Helianthus annuus]
MLGFCVALKDVVFHALFWLGFCPSLKTMAYASLGFIVEQLMLLFNLDFGLQLFLDIWMKPFEFVRACEGITIMFTGDLLCSYNYC